MAARVATVAPLPPPPPPAAAAAAATKTRAATGAAASLEWIKKVSSVSVSAYILRVLTFRSWRSQSRSRSARTSTRLAAAGGAGPTWPVIVARPHGGDAGLAGHVAGRGTGDSGTHIRQRGQRPLAGLVSR